MTLNVSPAPTTAVPVRVGVVSLVVRLSTVGAAGAVVSTVNASLALAANVLLAPSVMPEPVALRVRA